jgi:hypothetical protein
MNGPKNVRSLILWIAITVMPGCGGSGTSSGTAVPTPSPTPIPPPPLILSQQSGSLPARNLALVPFDSPALGTLDVTVDWTFATNDVHIYLVRGDCDFERFVAQQCPLVAFSESRTAKPERMTVTAASMGRYTLGIGNASDSDESIAYQVVLIRGAGSLGAATAGLDP